MCTKTIFIEYFYSTILFFMQTISSIDTFDFSFLTGSGEYCGFPSKWKNTLKTTTVTETILLIDSKVEVGIKCKMNKVFLSPAFFLINVNLFNIKYCQ